MCGRKPGEEKMFHRMTYSMLWSMLRRSDGCEPMSGNVNKHDHVNRRKYESQLEKPWVFQDSHIPIVP